MDNVLYTLLYLYIGGEVVLLLTAQSKVLLLVILLKSAQPTGSTCTRPPGPRNSMDSEGYPIAQKNKSTFKSITNNSTFE